MSLDRLDIGILSILKSCRIEKGRRFYSPRYAARLVWDIYHPDDLAQGNEIIHHIDGNPLNDHPDNLQKMKRNNHTSQHLKGKKMSDETKAKLSLSHKGKKATDATKLKMSITGKGRVFSEEHKRKIGEANKRRIFTNDMRLHCQKGRLRSEESKKKQSISLIGNKNHFYGKHHSEESKRKISETKLLKRKENML